MRVLVALPIVLLLAGCQTTSAIPDSYCSLYSPVIQAKGDGTISATSGVKRRLLANELTYRKLCSNKK